MESVEHGLCRVWKLWRVDFSGEGRREVEGVRQVSGLALWIRWVLYELRCLLGTSFVPDASLRIEGRIPREALDRRDKAKSDEGRGVGGGGLTAGARRVVHTLRVIYNMRDVLINELSQRQLLNINQPVVAAPFSWPILARTTK